MPNRPLVVAPVVWWCSGLHSGFAARPLRAARRVGTGGGRAFSPDLAFPPTGQARTITVALDRDRVGWLRRTGRMSRPRPGNARRAYASWALLGLSVVLFAIVAVLWYRDRESKPTVAPPPASTPGFNQAIHVKEALEAQGLKVAFAPGGGRSEDLSVAGQLFDVNGQSLYVFIYPEGPQQLQDDTVDLDLSAVSVVNTQGTPVAAGDPQVFSGSNVIAVLYGSSSDIANKVKAAIEGLP
jgi:hypothetical protein